MRAELFALPQHIPDVRRLATLRTIRHPVTGGPCWLGHPVRLSDGRHVTSHPFLSRTSVIATRVRLGVIGCVGGCGLNQSTGQFTTAGGPCTTGPIITTDASGVFAHSRAA